MLERFRFTTKDSANKALQICKNYGLDGWIDPPALKLVEPNPFYMLLVFACEDKLNGLDVELLKEFDKNYGFGSFVVYDPKNGKG